MNNLSISNVCMDSREIAELTGKNHNHVVRDIEKMLTDLGGVTNFGHTYTHPQNKQEYRCFVLPKRETLILVSGYSVELRAKIIDRLEYLEQQNKPALPQSFADALLLAYNQQKQLEEQAPKVEFYDKVLDSSTCFTTTQLATELNMSAVKLNKLLCVENIQYKQSNQYHLYAKHKGKGYEDVRTVPFTHKDGSIGTKHYLVWTEKGREFIYGVVK